MPLKISDALRKKVFGENVSGITGEQPIETNQAKDYNKMLGQKNDIMKEYLKTQSIISRMSPEKKQVYGKLVNELYAPHLKQFIKEETVTDVMGKFTPEKLKQYGDTSWEKFSKFYPMVESQKTVGDYFKGGQVSEEYKGLEDFPLSQANKIVEIRLKAKTQSEKENLDTLVELLKIKFKQGE